MSGHSRSQSDVDELLQIGTRCTQLRKEKELLKESRPQSFGLIRRLEEHVNSLSAERSEDKKRLEMLEKELRNCSQEIDFVQDQLNSRDEDVNLLEEHVKSLELRLRDTEMLHYEVGNLREELNRSDSQCLLFMRELESREVELQNSSLCVEKLRESISAITLDSQCEIESMKLDIVALEQNCIEAEKEASRERARMSQLILELEARYRDTEKINACLEFENKKLKEKIDTSEMKFRAFWQRLEKWLEKHGSFVNIKVLVNELESKLLTSKEEREETSEEVLSPLIAKLETILRSDCDVVEDLSKQLEGYELLVKQLKEELREEKSKAKEEAEDLAQEMAELRYQMTGLLEEERKRRAHIEQASIQRIAELELKVKREQEDSVNNAGYLHEA